jgi:hypothetical protein
MRRTSRAQRFVHATTRIVGSPFSPEEPGRARRWSHLLLRTRTWRTLPVIFPRLKPELLKFRIDPTQAHQLRASQRCCALCPVEPAQGPMRQVARLRPTMGSFLSRRYSKRQTCSFMARGHPVHTAAATSILACFPHEGLFRPWWHWAGGLRRCIRFLKPCRTQMLGHSLA